METTDFNNSYMTWSANANLEDTRKPGHMPWGNAARILIDARCTIFEKDREEGKELYLIAPCRTEWMYRDQEMIQNPSGEYRVIFSNDMQLFVGKSIAETVERSAATSTSGFNWVTFSIQTSKATKLQTNAEVVEATMRNVPIVAQTTIAGNGLRAVLEYPIRTMNFHEERVRFQVDTGPLIFPDLDSKAELLIDRCYLAHTIYNTFDYAEFVGKQPTPLEQEGQSVASIYHYSRYWSLNVVNELFAVE